MMEDVKCHIGSELCRLCLKETGESDLFEKQELIQDIYLCTGVKVIRSNNLPRKICRQCLKTVMDAKHLRLIVKENETQMRILFDHEDPNIQDIDELSNDEDSSIHYTESRSSKGDKDTTDDENNIKRTKRQRTISENEPTKKISVRKDLFTYPKTMNPQDKDCTYIEGTKYGISKTSTVSEMNDVKVTYTCAVSTLSHRTLNLTQCHLIPKCAQKHSHRGKKYTATGERPYACDICDKSFSQRGTLKVHKETVHLVAGETLVLYVKD